MSGSDGISRLRKAVDNQASLGEAAFMLPVGEMLAMLDEAEEELARLSWAEGVPAPVDADGNAVPLDTTELYTDKGETVYVVSILFNTCLWYVRSANTSKTYLLSELHRTEQDSWRKLEKDVRNAENSDVCGYYGIGTEPCNEGCPGYKDLETPCAAIAMKDVLRRAKALAERDAKEAGRA